MPREFGIPQRFYLDSLDSLQHYETLYNGDSDCFVSVYQTPVNNHVTLDKIFFDFDQRTGLCSPEQALTDAKRVYKHLIDQGHTVAVIASGRKGIHIHVLLKPTTLTSENAKTTLYSASMQILTSTFGNIAQGMEYDSNNKQSSVYYALDEGSRVIGADPQITGDIRRICRLPNTRRPPENLSWCVWVPNRKFLKMSWIDIINQTKHPEQASPLPSPTKTILDIPKFNTPLTIIPSQYHESDTNPSGESILLSGLLRPCIYNAIREINPTHKARVAATIDLLPIWSPNEIADMYSQLNWFDWDREATLLQINYCKKYYPYSCNTLRSQGICIVEHEKDCPIPPVIVKDMNQLNLKALD